MKNKFIKYFIIISSFSLQLTLYMQPIEYALKVAFIERFTLFTDWPENVKMEDTTKPFVISVIGNNSFEDKLDHFSYSKKIKRRKIEVRYINKISEIIGSHILFISKSEKVNLSSILKYTENRPILTIGDTDGFAEQGVIINMYSQNNQLRFQINETAQKLSGLYMNFKLLSLAEIVNPVGGGK